MWLGTLLWFICDFFCSFPSLVYVMYLRANVMSRLSWSRVHGSHITSASVRNLRTSLSRNIPDFPSDIPAVLWNFVYLVSHCVWDLLSTCETRSVPVRGEAASWNKPDSSPELYQRIIGAPHLHNKSIPFIIHFLFVMTKICHFH